MLIEMKILELSEVEMSFTDCTGFQIPNIVVVGAYSFSLTGSVGDTDQH